MRNILFHGQSIQHQENIHQNLPKPLLKQPLLYLEKQSKNQMELSERSSFRQTAQNLSHLTENFSILEATFEEVENPHKQHSLLGDGNGERDQEVTYKSRCYLIMMVLNIALSSFYYGYGYCMVYFAQMKIDTMLEILKFKEIDSNFAGGLLNGAISIGAFFGAISSSFLITHFSRRNGLLAVNAFAFVVGGLIFIENFYSLLIFRLLQGMAVGLYSSVTPIIIKQLSPIEISGSLGSYTQLKIAFGMFFGCIFAYILSRITNDETGGKYWYYVYAFPQLIIIFQTIFLLFVFPFETPKYLLLLGQEAEAKALIDIIYKQEYAQKIFQQKKKQIQLLILKISFREDTEQTKKPSGNSIPFIVALNLSALRQFSGTNAVTVYAGSIASKIITGQILLLIPSIVNFAIFFGSFLSGFILGRLGRKTAAQLGSLAEILANTLVIVGMYITTGGRALEGTLTIVGLFLCKLFFGTFIGPITWQYMPEIIEPRLIPYTTTVNWFTGSLVVTLFPILADGVLTNPAPIFVFFVVYCTLSFIFNQFFMVETKGKTQFEIKQEFKELKLC